MSSTTFLSFTLVETRDSRNNRALLVQRQFRINWKRKNLAASRLCVRQIPVVVAEIRECRLNMKRARIVDLGRNSSVAQIRLQFISPRDSNRILVVHMKAVFRRTREGQHQIVFGEQVAVVFGVLPMTSG